MLSKKLLKELSKFTTSYEDYFKAKQLVEKYEQFLSSENKLLTQIFYIDYYNGVYDEYLFDSFESEDRIVLRRKCEHCETGFSYLSTPIEGVFITKQENMITKNWND